MLKLANSSHKLLGEEIRSVTRIIFWRKWWGGTSGMYYETGKNRGAMPRISG